MSIRLVLAGLAALTLSACATAPASTQTTAPQAVNPIAKDPRVESLVAAGVKPLAGPAIGSYVDQEQAQLQAAVGTTGASVNRVGNQLVVDLPALLTFGGSSATIESGFKPTLAAIGQILKQNNRSIIDVYGYTDAVGPDAENRALSQRRAVAVATWLSAQGVDQRRFYIEGRGGADPVATNATAAGRAQNQRVDIQISPLVAPAQ